MIRSARPKLAEVPLADLFFVGPIYSLVPPALSVVALLKRDP